MNKKILLALGSVLVVVGGVAALSAFEAHVINVTAKIENALTVPAEAIPFGTVFPQEYLERNFIIRLSESFLADDQLRLGDVYYKIVQKPKLKPLYEELVAQCPECTLHDAREWCATHGPGDELTAPHPGGSWPYENLCYPNLCRFLSKIGEDEYGTVNVDSYYHDSDPDYCVAPAYEVAEGYLEKCHPLNVACVPGEDIIDCWKVDLKVPPVDGYVGQDWPESCADWVVPTNAVTYGCDLWVEVARFSNLPQPPETPVCGDGWITPPEECDSGIGCEMGEYCDVCMCYPK